MGVNKVEIIEDGQPRTIIDLTEDTVTPETMVVGATAHDASGELIEGNLRPVLYSEQSLTTEQQAQARENINALGREELPEAVNDALTQAKESGEFDGKTPVINEDGYVVFGTPFDTDGVTRGEFLKLSSEKADRTEVDTLVKNTVENEKGNIVQLLIEELNGLPVFGVIDENNTVTVTSLLPDGVYTLKYENEDGTTTEIGTITVGNGEVIKYTNLVDTTPTTDTTITTASKGWLENVRINSSNAIVTVDGNHITNNIAVGNGVKLRCKGMNINGGYGRIYAYNGTTLVYSIACSNNINSFVEITNDYAEILVSEILKVVQANKGSNVTFDNVRFGGTLTSTKENVIVTLDEEII